jgi:hypothetical protein
MDGLAPAIENTSACSSLVDLRAAVIVTEALLRIARAHAEFLKSKLHDAPVVFERERARAHSTLMDAMAYIEMLETRLDALLHTRSVVHRASVRTEHGARMDKLCEGHSSGEIGLFRFRVEHARAYLRCEPGCILQS